MKLITSYERACGTTPSSMDAESDMELDADEQHVYFRGGKEEAAKHLAAGIELEPNFGPRNMSQNLAELQLWILNQA